MVEPYFTGHWSRDWFGNFYGYRNRDSWTKTASFVNPERTPTAILNYPFHLRSGRDQSAGPAIAISFVLVAVVCGFASVCYAELAAMIPIAGSAYTYTYATMGELIAWIIGWDLILEYAVSNMAVSVGFSAHMVDLLDWFGLHPDPKWISPAYVALRIAGIYRAR